MPKIEQQTLIPDLEFYGEQKTNKEAFKSMADIIILGRKTEQVDGVHGV